MHKDILHLLKEELENTIIRHKLKGIDELQKLHDMEGTDKATGEVGSRRDYLRAAPHFGQNLARPGADVPHLGQIGTAWTTGGGGERLSSRQVDLILEEHNVLHRNDVIPWHVHLCARLCCNAKGNVPVPEVHGHIFDVSHQCALAIYDLHSSEALRRNKLRLA